MPDTQRGEMEKKVAEEVDFTVFRDGVCFHTEREEKLFSALVSARLELEKKDAVIQRFRGLALLPATAIPEEVIAHYEQFPKGLSAELEKMKGENKGAFRAGYLRCRRFYSTEPEDETMELSIDNDFAAFLSTRKES